MKQNVNALICLLNDITHIKSKQKKANGKKTSEGKHEKRVRKKKHYIILPAAVATAKNMSTSNRNNNNNKQRGKAATAQPQGSAVLIVPRYHTEMSLLFLDLKKCVATCVATLIFAPSAPP